LLNLDIFGFISAATRGFCPRSRATSHILDASRENSQVMAQAAANALTNLARAAMGLGVGFTAVNASIYDGASAIRSRDPPPADASSEKLPDNRPRHRSNRRPIRSLTSTRFPLSP
jgi:hypothetical protein